MAVFGLITKEAATYPAGKEAFDVADEIAAARRTVTALKGQADIIVALSHAGEAVDRRLAEQVPGDRRDCRRPLAHAAAVG